MPEIRPVGYGEVDLRAFTRRVRAGTRHCSDRYHRPIREVARSGPPECIELLAESEPGSAAVRHPVSFTPD
jgi:hypothetical protein